MDDAAAKKYPSRASAVRPENDESSGVLKCPGCSSPAAPRCDAWSGPILCRCLAARLLSMQGPVIDCTGNGIQYVGGRSHQLPTLLLCFHLRDITNDMPEEQDQSHSPIFTLSDAAKHQLPSHPWRGFGGCQIPQERGDVVFPERTEAEESSHYCLSHLI